MERIVTAEEATGQVERPAEWPLALKGIEPPAATAPASKKVTAYINHGRWVVECPDCRSAQAGSPADPRFFCIECRNGWVAGRWLKVEYPAGPRRADIEEALLRRPMSRNRNWYPHESVGDLRKQNVANGVV